MSTYGKQPHPQLPGFDPSRTFHEPTPIFSPSAYTTQPPANNALTATFNSAAQNTQVAYATQGGRPHYSNDNGAYTNAVASSMPHVTTYSPYFGNGGIRILVYVSSPYQLSTPEAPKVYLVFGNRRCGTAVTRMEETGSDLFSYVVTTEVPQFSLTGYQTAQVPMSLLLKSEMEDFMYKVDVGAFTYRDADVQTAVAQRAAEREPAASATSLEGIPAFYPQQHNDSYNSMPHYGRPNINYETPASQSQIYSFSNPTSTSPPQFRDGSPSIWSYPQATSQQQHSPASVESVPMQKRSLSEVSSSQSLDLRFVRTSTLQSPLSSDMPSHTGYSGSYSVHSYPKAQLILQGDLASMTDNWSRDEWDCKRRILLFRRSQSGAKISAHFRPIEPENRPHNSVCISCIYWEEKKECFVTSVDGIYLLEQLVNERFSVEEKNRIRRNLEGFRPLTVSKGKAGSENFFKLIMGFPNPKPRNIEKDVKVYSWKVLQAALKKIIGKYSAIPASGLRQPPNAILTPSSSTGYAEVNYPQPYQMDDDITQSYDLQNVLRSPRSTTYSLSQAYAHQGSRPISPPLSLQHSNSSNSAANCISHPTDALRIAVPANTNNYYTDLNNLHPDEAHSNYSSACQTPTTAYLRHSKSTNHSARGSWDLTAGCVAIPTSMIPMRTSISAGSHLEPGTGNSMAPVSAGPYDLGPGQEGEEMPVGISVPKLLEG